MTTVAQLNNPALDLLIREPADAYHAKRGEWLTSHRLADFRKSPERFQLKQLGIIQDDDRPAFFFGRAAHTLILEGHQRFHEDYIVGGPINPRTNKSFERESKRWSEWAAQQSKVPLCQSEFDLISRLSASVHAQPTAASLLRQGVPEGVVRTNYCGVPCQARLDWFNPEHGIVDLKTCYELAYFEDDVRMYGYVHQLAFYRALLQQLIGELVPVHLIAVEKNQPYGCKVVRLADHLLANARQENEAAIEQLKRSQILTQRIAGF